MKKLLLLVVLVISSVTIMAQKRAIGGRLNNGVEFSYQHSMGDANMLEFDLGFWGVGDNGGVSVFGLYDWIMPLNTFEDGTQMNWYAGVGAGLGTWWDDKGEWNKHTDSWDRQSNFNIAVAGQIGVEYTFKFPLQLSLDVRPTLGLDLGDNSGVYFDAYRRSAFSLGVRYKF